MPGPVITISNAYALEDDYLTFVVTLSEASDFPVTVDYRTIPGTAWWDDDFNYENDSLFFDAGETSKTIRIESEGDGSNERDEAFEIELNDPVNAVFSNAVPTIRATGWIRDSTFDGIEPNLALFVSNPTITEGASGLKEVTFEITLSEPAGSTLQMSYTTSAETADSGDFVAESGTVTFLPGQSSAFVTVEVIGDTIIENTETFSLIVTPHPSIQSGRSGATGTATIFEDDSGSSLPTISVSRGVGIEDTFGDYAYFTVSLSRPVLDYVEVDWRILPGTAQLDTDLPYDTDTLVFDPGETSLTFKTRIYDDGLQETDESFILELLEPVNATLAGGGPVLRSTGWILDDDGISSDLAIFVSDPVVVEVDGTKQVLFEVSISEAVTSPMTMAYSTSNGTATAGQDYVAETGQITFQPGQTTKTVSIAIIGDTIQEGTESFNLSVTPHSLIVGRSGAFGTAEIRDDDAPTEGPDFIVGTSLSESRSALGGNDVIEMRAGNDTAYGGIGNDSIKGEGGNDALNGDAGNDKIFGGEQNDNLVGGDGRDSSYGGSGKDTLFDGNGSDKVYGGTGSDRLSGGVGNDAMYGGADRDTFYFFDGRDRVKDFRNDADEILFSQYLWGGGAKSDSAILRYGDIKNGDAVFNFGNGDVLVIEDVSRLSSLKDDIGFY